MNEERKISFSNGLKVYILDVNKINLPLLRAKQTSMIELEKTYNVSKHNDRELKRGNQITYR